MSNGKKCPECGRMSLDHSESEIEACWMHIKAAEWVRSRVSLMKMSGHVARSFGTQTFTESAIEYPQDIMGWIESDATSLYIYGACGVGKTYAARAILYDALTSRSTVGEVTAHHLIAMARRFDGHITTAKYAQFKYLLIDDIDKPKWSSADVRFLWDLLDARATNGGRTIITTNVKPEDLRKVLSDNDNSNGSIIESTLQRLAPVATVELTGKSLRGTK